MDFAQTLEKAVLEHAAELKRRPPSNNSGPKPSGPTKIPGFPDNLVWSAARQLSEKGYISTSSIGENGQLVIDDLSEEGSNRLREIREVAEQEEQDKRAEYEKAVEEARRQKKPWWKFWG